MKYNKDMTVTQVILSNPQNIEVFHKYGLKCLTCLGAETETLEEVARANEINLDKIIHELNNQQKNACD